MRSPGAPSFGTPAQAQASSAPVRYSTPGQNTCVVSTLPEHGIGGITRSTVENSPASPIFASPNENIGPLVQCLVDGDPISSLTGPDFACVCTNKLWIAWCPRAKEHYSTAILYSSWLTHYPCLCGWTLSMPQLPWCCPKAASHFLDWVSHYCSMYTRDVG